MADRKTWVISDTHFGHRNICRFLRPDGTRLRPFSDSDEMDAVMVERWNAVIGPEDKVYHLGDVATGGRTLRIMERLNGSRKILIKGNHDTEELREYAKYFHDVRSLVVLGGCIFSHAPLHPSTLYKFGCNVHGHTHCNKITLPDNTPDPNYLNICVEWTDYAPILLDDVFKRVVAQGGIVGFKTRKENNSVSTAY